MKTICGIDCSGCGFIDNCKGCTETNGRPFGGDCIAAECYNSAAETSFFPNKNPLLKRSNPFGFPVIPR